MGDTASRKIRRLIPYAGQEMLERALPAPERVLMAFRQGEDTWSIARELTFAEERPVREHQVLQALSQARDDERRQRRAS